MAKAKRLPSGSWRVLLYVGKDEKGKRKYKSFTAESRRDAELAAAEYAASNPNNKPDCDLTLGEAMDKYIDSKRNVVSPSTLRGYLNIRKAHLQELSRFSLSALTPEAVQKAFNNEAASHSPKTVRNVSGLFTSTIKMFAPSLRFNITLPQKTKTQLYIPTPSDIKTLYSLVQNTDMELPFLLASQCGLRRSEICALTWDDISEGNINVCKAVVPGPDGYVTKQPKSLAGYRHVDCAVSLTDRVLSIKNDSPFVCQIRDPELISDKWRRIIKKSGLPYCRFHDLRHYYASVGLLAGIPPKYMADLMGHGSTDMIDKVYQHIFADSRRSFAEKLMAYTDELLKNSIAG